MRLSKKPEEKLQTNETNPPTARSKSSPTIFYFLITYQETLYEKLQPGHSIQVPGTCSPFHRQIPFTCYCWHCPRRHSAATDGRINRQCRMVKPGGISAEDS